MGPLLKLLIGISVILLIGIMSMRASILPGSLISAQNKLQLSTTMALSNSDADWAHADVNGQKAILSGNAPSQSALDTTISAIENATWSGGLFLGGVTTVDSSKVIITLSQSVSSPLTWQAVSENGNIIMSGSVPSDVARISISQLATKLFPTYLVTGDLKVIKSEVDESNWRTAISIGLKALSLLENGTINAEGTRVSLRGTHKDQAQSDEAKRLMATLPEEFQVDFSLIIPASPAQETVAEIQEPEAATVEIETPEPTPEDQIATVLIAEAEQIVIERENPVTDEVETCVTKLHPLVANQRITVAHGRDVLNDESRRFLRELAITLSECPDAMLTITGHTDSTGRETSNRRLSLKRANTAAAQLRSLGLDNNQIQTFGVGSQMPLQQNATVRGRASNRRIEFDISYEPSQD